MQRSLNHALITQGSTHQFGKSTNFICKNADEIRIPTLLMHGSADSITSHEATSDLSRKIPKATYIEWSDCYHELHHETVANEVFDTILNWINEQL